MATQTANRRLALTEEELATLLASEYRRGYSTGIVIGQSGAEALYSSNVRTTRRSFDEEHGLCSSTRCYMTHPHAPH